MTLNQTMNTYLESEDSSVIERRDPFAEGFRRGFREAFFGMSEPVRIAEEDVKVHVVRGSDLRSRHMSLRIKIVDDRKRSA